MKYKIISQNPVDERVSVLQDKQGERFNVDIYTDGAFESPIGVDATAESWREWLGTFVGKEIEIEYITPYIYFSGGKTKLLN